MGRLDGKVAIITGSARGQGEAEARLFVAEGARVVLGDVLDGEGRAVAESLGAAATYVHHDIRSESDWEAAVAAAAAFGPLNVLVNEHRLYLASACLSIATVAAAWPRMLGRWPTRNAARRRSPATPAHRFGMSVTVLPVWSCIPR